MYLGMTKEINQDKQQERLANRETVAMTYGPHGPHQTDCQNRVLPPRMTLESEGDLEQHQEGQLATDQLIDRNDNGPENGEECGGGFGYSQKFFHISDGNLYSVFSPLQGRSYGVKPSFLRKHRCTVRETKTGGTGNTNAKKTGRRNQRRGLKFHNFIPSESITSEREEKVAGSNTDQNGRKKKGLTSESGGQIGGTGEVWKVHAECRLREEHGTKQIMVSNWSLSSDSPALPKSPKPQPISVVKAKAEEAPKAPKTELLLQPEVKPNTANKPSVLQQYLEYGKMLPDSDNSGISLDPDINRVKNELDFDQDDSKKRRRKPTTTRRVVPYNKYLSMVDDGPLDLSCQNKFDDDENLLLKMETNCTVSELEKIENRATTSARVYGQLANQTLPPGFMSLPRNHPAGNTNYQIGQQATTSYQNSQGNSYQISQVGSQCSQGANYQNSQGTLAYQISPHGTGYQSNPCTLENGAANRVRRKPSQRTIIRQKLEDTFKQNGFLVKTKQVSDGDATFCKFKQLRKYTRYYLKSWHQHLPDEVHKLWKGFLPPKTTLNVHAKNSNNVQSETTPTNVQELTVENNPQLTEHEPMMS